MPNGLLYFYNYAYLNNVFSVLLQMDVFNLPHDIEACHDKNSEVFIYHYNAPVESVKGKSVLHKNVVSLVVRGTKTMHFANKTVTIRDGEFHFLSVGNCIVSMDMDKNQPFESVLVFFGNKALADFYLKYKNEIADIKKNNKIETEPYITFKKSVFVNNYISFLRQSGSQLSSQMQLVKFEELMLHLLENYPLQFLAFPLNKSMELEDMEIRKAVEVNFVNNLSLDELAFICNLSLATFKRRFMKIYGVAPGKWLLQKRMELAGDLISRNGERPGEIFYKVGYENHSSFSKSFKQYFGVTPKAYQQTH